jgi:ABC-type maltose transport system permease subunit
LRELQPFQEQDMLHKEMAREAALLPENASFWGNSFARALCRASRAVDALICINHIRIAFGNCFHRACILAATASYALSRINFMSHCYSSVYFLMTILYQNDD